MKVLRSILVLMMSMMNMQANDTEEQIIEKYQDIQPQEWAETVTRVKTRLITDDKVIALTLDACGSVGDSCDYPLLNFLIDNNIPATIFVTGKWIDKHREDFNFLLSNKLFDIQNHGLNHRPASVNGKSIYNIPGTLSIRALIREVEDAAQKIEILTGKKTRFFRSGTAFYDEVATAVIEDLGYQVAGFSVLGDAGTTYKTHEVVEALHSAKAGDIVILHMNHPERDTGPGVIAGLPELIKRGFTFVHMKDYELE